MTLYLTAAALVLLAIGLRKWALRAVNGAGVRSLHQLVNTTKPDYFTTKGPYRWFRHPMYFSNILFIAAVGVLAFGSWAGLVLCLPALPYYTGRMINENSIRGEV